MTGPFSWFFSVLPAPSVALAGNPVAGISPFAGSASSYACPRSGARVGLLGVMRVVVLINRVSDGRDFLNYSYYVSPLMFGTCGTSMNANLLQ